MGTPHSEAVVTLEAFNRLEHGMSYEHVCKIIGCDGHVLFRIGGVGGVPETVMYTWNGVGMVGANMNATFKDGKLTSKAQFGLDQSPSLSRQVTAIDTQSRDGASRGDKRKN